MNRTYIQGLLMFLLVQLPVGLLAQSVTGMQYWFDNGSKHTISISEGETTKHLNTDGLSVGMHTLYYRFIQSGGDVVWEGDVTDIETGEVTHESTYYADLEYSPVYSSRFFKHEPSQGSMVEYWFDNKSSKKTTAITGAENETVKLDLTDMSMFPLGFHQLNMRFSTPGKSPSAIYTADVMKFSAGSNYLEYWVDDNQEKSKKLKTGSGSASIYVTTAMPLDLNDVTPGFHRLYFRTCNANGVAGSAVYSAMIYRNASEASQIEYWFDDDASTIQKKQFVEAYQNGAAYPIDLTSDVFPQGLHMLNIRVSTKNGGKGAIYSTPVVKMAANSFKTIEFWLDDDRENVQTLSGSLSINGVAIVGNLDFSDTDPGMHYLHYRAVGTDGKPSNAVGEEPIMVKSRYNTDGSDAVVTRVGYSIDGAQFTTNEVAHQQHALDYEYTIDMKKCSEGAHTLKAIAWNSLGTNNVVLGSFSVAGEKTPEISLTAQEENGQVKLSYAVIPNAVESIIERFNVEKQSARDIMVDTETSYPGVVVHYDQPATGSYTYKVRCKYTDFKGRTQYVSSPDVAVTFVKPEEKPEVADIYGYIENYVFTPSIVTVRASDDIVAVVNSYGGFVLHNLPVGMSFTPEVQGDNRYDYTCSPVKVSKKNPTLVLKGELKESILQDNISSHLALDGRLNWTSPARNVTFKVRNLSSKKWKGYVRAKAVYSWFGNDETNKEKLSSGENVRELPSRDDAQIIEIEGSQTADITIQTWVLSSWLFNKYWHFYLETVGNWDGDASVVRPLDCGYQENYFTQEIPKGLKATDNKNSLDNDEKEGLASMILMLSSQVNGLDDYVADLSKYDAKVKEAARLYGDVDGLLASLASADIEDILNGPSFQTVRDYLFMPFKDMALSQVHERYGYKITGALEEYNKITTIFSDLLAAREFMTAHTDRERYFIVADWIANQAIGSNPLVGSVLKSYVVLSKTIIDKIQDIASGIYDANLAGYLKGNVLEKYDNNSEYEKFNKNIDFRLRVKKGKGKKYFSPEDVRRQIKEVWIKASHNGGESFSQFKSEAICVKADETDEIMRQNKDYVMIKQTDTGYSNGAAGDIDQGTIVDLFVEIHWMNGVVTKVPLLKESVDNIHFELGTKTKPSCYTFEFESAESKAASRMADDIHLGKSLK